MSIALIIYETNNAILRKILIITQNRSARFGVSSPLGTLGRRFESCRPDSYNPSHRKVSEPVFFYWLKYDILLFMSYLCHMPVFAELFMVVLSYSIYFFRDKHLKS